MFCLQPATKTKNYVYSDNKAFISQRKNISVEFFDVFQVLMWTVLIILGRVHCSVLLWWAKGRWQICSFIMELIPTSKSGSGTLYGNLPLSACPLSKTWFWSFEFYNCELVYQLCSDVAWTRLVKGVQCSKYKSGFNWYIINLILVAVRTGAPQFMQVYSPATRQWWVACWMLEEI